MSQLFSTFELRDFKFKNRIFVSPMCQYSAQDGIPTDWHLVHLGSRAVGGAGLVFTEATSIHPDGRLTPGDTGIWNDTQAEAFRPIARFIKSQGAAAGIQLAHAGRKASTEVPWKGGHVLKPGQGGWIPIAPSPISFNTSDSIPIEMDRLEIQKVIEGFREGAKRSLVAGFDVVEIHMAHGYLLHEFLSPLSNHRTDEYGGVFENRIRLPLEVSRAVREVWPAGQPVFVRISATDWMDSGWDLTQSIAFSIKLKECGIDLIDCSSGGLVPHAKIVTQPGYQVPFAEAIRKESGIATGAVGMITRPEQAEEIIAQRQADVVLIAREMLRQPHWALHAAQTLEGLAPWPNQYERAKLAPPRIK